ncbi:MAG: class I SAM-dependent methyltransferase [Bacteriovoracaceae bacterium]|jgi:16S rRNA G966 N2-methylase RsmD|nr:hypothetical protein [Halobacteriovoraceae bacterium]MDP7320017.1 class I SAM-dependent methyltransferase [Bacteriovoracaceae bacterium]
MNIIKSSKKIDFEAFATFCPEEARILKDIKAAPYTLRVDELGKIALSQEPFSPIFIAVADILEKHKKFFYKSSIYKDLLAKAIGLKKGKKRPSVLDATAGLLGDSLLMYSYGLEKLICVERHPLAAALITNGLKFSAAKIEFYYGDILNYCSNLASKPDVIFFDPMYAQKNLKSAPKKEMSIFRHIIGEDTDALMVAKKLRGFTRERLVIKRSNKADSLLGKPDLIHKGKSTSYDVYLSISK